MDTIIRFFQEGGTFMYPIAIILAIGLAVTLERFIFLCYKNVISVPH
jgi:biopolymer transport protein ExbB